ncbi:MAG: hypothetical protein ACOH5I_09385 [Oligoflexus sp.]
MQMRRTYLTYFQNFHWVHALSLMFNLVVLPLAFSQAANKSESVPTEDFNVNFCADQEELEPILGNDAPIALKQLELHFRFEGRLQSRHATLFLPQAQQALSLVLFFNGGTISGDRYDWLARLVASHGFAALMVEDQTGPSFSRLQWLPAALEAFQDSELATLVDTQRIILGGHSFGGVCVFCLNHPSSCSYQGNIPSLPENVIGFFTINSHLQSKARPENMEVIPLSRPILMISGTRDGYAKAETIEKTFRRLRGNKPAFLERIEGSNHFQALDCLDPNQDRYENDNPAEISHQAAASLIGQVLIDYLNWLVSR